MNHSGDDPFLDKLIFDSGDGDQQVHVRKRFEALLDKAPANGLFAGHNSKMESPVWNNIEIFCMLLSAELPADVTRPRVT